MLLGYIIYIKTEVTRFLMTSEQTKITHILVTKTVHLVLSISIFQCLGVGVLHAHLLLTKKTYEL